MSTSFSFTPYLEAAARGALAFPRCVDCRRHHFHPRPACPYCGSRRLDWQDVSGRGQIYSFSVVHRPASPIFAPDVPYTIAIVATDEGPHLMCRIVGIPPAVIAIGLRVRARFEPFGDVTLPVFELEEDA